MNFYYLKKPNRITIDSPILERMNRDPNFILQIKKNGWRIEILKDGDDVQFFSRHNKRLEPIVQDADWDLLRSLVINNIKTDKCAIDGEFLHRRGNKKNTLFLWDLIELDGKIQKTNYKDRKSLLDSIIIPSDNLTVAQDFKDSFVEIWDQLENPEENEGVVIKDLREGSTASLYPISKTSPKQFKILLEDKRNYVGK